MHLKFGAELALALLNRNLPNKRAHAALVNLYLKQAMDHYLSTNINSGLMSVTPAISGLLNQAAAMDSNSYMEWVATMAGELVTDPDQYVQHGYTVPWEGISEPFLVRVWKQGDEQFATDVDDLPF